MVLACMPSHVLLFWTLCSTGGSCLDFFTYGVFCMLSWPQYQSSLHSVSFSRVWLTSFAWQIPDVLPEFISGFFMSLFQTSMYMCVLMPMKNYSLIRDLVSQLPSSPTPFLPPPEKMFIFQVLDLLQTPFILSISPALTNLGPFLHGMQSSLRFCNLFSL